jgi:DNA-binding transcriptional regulator YbjK
MCYQQADKKKEKKTDLLQKQTENKQKRMKKSTHKTAHPAKNAQINRTNLFFAGRAVSLPTREQKLVSLGF